ncbi:MAG: hypothetical protein ACO1O6_15795 [Bacteroidota bacterium]
MKKVLMMLCLSAGTYFNAQIEFNHSTGATFLLVIQDGYIGLYPGLTYNPRLDFKVHEEVSFSVTTYPTVAANVQYGYFALQVPVLAQVNLGHNSTADSDMPVGFFAGAGYSFGVYSDAGSISGPCLSAGLKFGGMHSYGIRFEMTQGKKYLDGDRDKVFSGGFFVNF